LRLASEVKATGRSEGPKGGSLARTLSRRVGWIGGVCAGIAYRFGVSPGLVRTLYVIVSVLSAAFPGILVYLVLWWIIPRDA